MSTHDPRETPQYSSPGDQAAGHAQQPAYGGQLGYAGGPNGYGHQQPGYHQPGPYGYQQGVQHYGAQPGVPVGFGEAIKRFYSKYAQFSGRASRSEYWWVQLFLAVVYLASLFLAQTVGADSVGNANGIGVVISLLLVAFMLGSIIPIVAISVRRLHDVDMSGFVYLVNFIPFIGWLIFLIFTILPPKPQGARFDR